MFRPGGSPLHYCADRPGSGFCRHRDYFQHVGRAMHDPPLGRWTHVTRILYPRIVYP